MASPVGRFFLAVVILLPLSFGAWYYMAIVITWPLTYLVDLVMTGLFPRAIAAVEQQGYILDVVTSFAPPPTPGLPPGRVGELVFELNPLIYGYSLPLYTALVLATPGKESAKWGIWILGMLVLFPIQAWGVCFDILKTLLFGLGPEIGGQLGFAQWQIEAVALGYQFGSLILPAVTPVVLWIAFHRSYLATLVPGFAGRFAPPGPGHNRG
jgi:hypothetical protein